MKAKKLLVAFSATVISLASFGQENHKAEIQQTPVPVPAFEINVQEEVKKAGILILDQSIKLSDYDLMQIANYDFDNYRNYSTHRKIQLVNGPVIDLNSLTERVSSGTKISAELMQQKANPDLAAAKHDIITLVDVGLGKAYTQPLH